MYSLEKGRFSNYIKEILSKKKLYFTDKSIFLDRVYSDELLVTLDLLSQVKLKYS
jgi:hypothetical protein